MNKVLKKILIFLLVAVTLNNNLYAASNDCPGSDGSTLSKIWINKKFSAFVRIKKSNSRPIKIIDDVSPNSINIAHLCNRTFAVVKENQFFSFGQRPTQVTGFVFNEDFTKKIAIFKFSNISGSHYSPRIAALKNDKFGVILTSQSNTPNTRTLYVKLFKLNADALSEAIVVVQAKDINGRSNIIGLPNGGFVVTWSQYQEGTFFKIFNPNGKAITKNIKVDIDALATHIYSLNDNTINIFFENNDSTKKDYMFEGSQGFNFKGKNVSNKLIAKEVILQDGYQAIVEEIIDRELLFFPPKRSGKCDYYNTTWRMATNLVKYTKINEKKKTLSDYCSK